MTFFLKRHFYLVPVLLLVTFGCRSCDTVESNKVAQSEIYQNYSVQASPNATAVTATFRVGGSTGTTIDLDSPSRIEYNGREMTENLRSVLSGTYYSSSTDKFEGRHQFTYTDGDGRVFSNEMSFEPVEPVAVPQTIKPGEKVTILLSRALTANESVSTSIVSEEKQAGTDTNANSNRQGNTTDDDRRYSTELYQNSNDTRNAVEIAPGALKNFAAGKAGLQIKVYSNLEIQQKTRAGGSMNYVYSSGTYDLTILPITKSEKMR